MATLRIHYSRSDYGQLLTGEIIAADFLDKLLKDKSAFGNIINHLTDYHNPDGGSIEINGFEVADCTYNPDTNKGQVKITYRIYYFYGCADITKDAGSHETWNFDVDAANNTLVLYMPEYEQRSTADEF